MTNEEAIKVLNMIETHGSLPTMAKELSIKALSQQPCEDCVSRQIISDYVANHIQEINTGYGDLNKHTNKILRMIVDYIEGIPPVTPQPKIGQWIEHPHEAGANWEYPKYECSECHVWEDDDSDFCPNCGAKMVEPQESEEKECADKKN